MSWAELRSPVTAMRLMIQKLSMLLTWPLALKSA